MAGELFRPGALGRRKGLAVGLLAIAFALVWATMASPASAETLVVANHNDSGAGSLREAIAKAAANDTIVVPAGQITLTSGPLAFAKNLTINGAGSAATTISGNDLSRVFTITGTPTVILAGLTITHGKDPAGAGISGSGEVTLQDVIVSGNHAGGAGVAGFGGGIEFAPGILTLIDSVVSENTAGGGAGGAGFGGGIDYDATSGKASFTLSLTRSRVSTNRAGVGDAGFGGGIDASSGQAEGSISISLTDSSLSGNVAGGSGPEPGFGGGLELSSGGAKNVLTLALDRTAVTGNTAGGGGTKASGFGGGIRYSSGGAEVTQTLTAVNSTISNNSAGGGGTEANGFGGGLDFGSGTASLTYVTVAGNSAGGTGGASFGGGVNIGSVGTGGIGSSVVAANSGGNCATAVVSRGHNIDDGASCGFTGTGDKSGVDAKLGPLGEHGGLSPTQMPLAGGPAIDAGDPATCPASDQRGVARPQAVACDIGAVEVARPVVTTGSVSSVGSEAATVGGTINPNFSATSFHVDYGTTSTYGNFTAVASAGEGGTAQAVSAVLSKLKPQTLYHFRVVASNAAGSVVGGDQTLTTSKAPIAPPPKKAVKAPALSSASLTNTRFRVGKKATAISARSRRRAPVGTRFRFKLTVAAKVQIAITRSASGLRRGRSCVAPTVKLRRAHARKCTRTLTVGKLSRANMRAGANAIAFSGRIGRRPLSPRAYRAVLTASNAGGRSRPVVLGFTVVH
jgi:hypothetical protein